MSRVPAVFFVVVFGEHATAHALPSSPSVLFVPSVVAGQVREVELSMDMASILRLLDFLEALFNGGSDFNEPLKRCLNRLTDAKWANSDILLVSGACVRVSDSKGRPAAERSGFRVCPFNVDAVVFSLPP